MIKNLINLRRFLDAAPKTVHHIHIEGSLDPELAGVDPANPPPFWRDDYRYDGFGDFRKAIYEYGYSYFNSTAHYAEGTKRLMETLRKQNVRYMEPSFRAGILPLLPETPDQFLRAIRAGIPKGIDVALFMGMSRQGDRYYEPNKKEIEAALVSPHLAGIDLHGAETPLEPWTAQVWELARACGKFTKAHLGEFESAACMRKGLKELDPDRVEHGVRAIDDPELVRWLIRNTMTLDMCPIANVKLGAVPSFAAHPALPLHRAGVKITFGPDNTFLMGNLRISDDYFAMATHSDFTYRDLGEIMKNGWDAALVPIATKEKYKRQIDRLVRVYEAAEREEAAKGISKPLLVPSLSIPRANLVIPPTRSLSQPPRHGLDRDLGR